MKSCKYCKVKRSNIDCVYHKGHHTEMSCPHWNKAKGKRLEALEGKYNEQK